MAALARVHRRAADRQRVAGRFDPAALAARFACGFDGARDGGVAAGNDGDIAAGLSGLCSRSLHRAAHTYIVRPRRDRSAGAVRICGGDVA